MESDEFLWWSKEMNDGGSGGFGELCLYRLGMFD